MNKKYFLTSLGVHTLLAVVAGFSFIEKEVPPTVQIGVEINISRTQTQFELKQKKILKLPKSQNISKTKSKNDLNPERNEEREQAQQELKDSGREQTLISQYATEVAKLINEKKFYPLMAKKLRQEGEVVIKITLGAIGNILALEIESPSRFSTLNAASIDCVRKISNFPPIPKALGVDRLTFSIPIEYKIL